MSCQRTINPIAFFDINRDCESAEARKAAESEGVALNQLITLALAEKVSAMRTEEYFEERARLADPARVSQILARVGKGNPPVEGDELPLEFAARKVRKKK